LALVSLVRGIVAATHKHIVRDALAYVIREYIAERRISYRKSVNKLQADTGETREAVIHEIPIRQSFSGKCWS
jgi:hypothetical protein